MKNTCIVSALVAVLGFALASAPVTVSAQTTPTQTTAATSTGSTTPSKPAKKKSSNTMIPKGATVIASIWLVCSPLPADRSYNHTQVYQP